MTALAIQLSSTNEDWTLEQRLESACMIAANVCCTVKFSCGLHVFYVDPDDRPEDLVRALNLAKARNEISVSVPRFRLLPAPRLRAVAS